MKLPEEINKNELMRILYHKQFCAEHALIDESLEYLDAEKMAKDLGSDLPLVDKKTRREEILTFIDELKDLIKKLEKNKEFTTEQYKMISAIVHQDLVLSGQVMSSLCTTLRTAKKFNLEFSEDSLCKGMDILNKRINKIENLLFQLNGDSNYIFIYK